MPLEKAVLPYLCSSVQVCSINEESVGVAVAVGVAIIAKQWGAS